MGRSWSTPVAVGAHVAASLSCPTAQLCLLDDGAGTALEFDPADLRQSRHQAIATALAWASCASASFCLAVGGALDSQIPATLVGGSSVFDGKSWTKAQAILNGGGFNAVTCASSRFCMAVGSSSSSSPLNQTGAPGFFDVYNGSSWGTPQAVDQGEGLYEVSCSSTKRCVALGSPSEQPQSAPTDVLTFDGSTWSSPTRPDGSTSTIRVLACVTNGPCTAVDDSGRVLTYNGVSWQTAGTVRTTTMSSLSCPTAQYCAGLDASSDVFFTRSSG